MRRALLMQTVIKLFRVIESFYTAITIIYDVMMCSDDVTFNETPLAATITATGVIGNGSCNSEGRVDVEL